MSEDTITIELHQQQMSIILTVLDITGTIGDENVTNCCIEIAQKLSEAVQRKLFPEKINAPSL